MFGSDTVVTVDTGSASDEQHQLGICSDSLETLKYIMESLGVKKVDLGTQAPSNLEEEFEHIMKLLKIANNSTPYDFMKAVLNNSKVQKNNDPALQKLGDNIDLFIKTQEQKMLENKEAFGTEYRKILDSQPLKAPLQDILF